MTQMIHSLSNPLPRVRSGLPAQARAYATRPPSP